MLAHPGQALLTQQPDGSHPMLILTNARAARYRNYLAFNKWCVLYRWTRTFCVVHCGRSNLGITRTETLGICSTQAGTKPLSQLAWGTQRMRFCRDSSPIASVFVWVARCDSSCGYQMWDCYYCWRRFELEAAHEPNNRYVCIHRLYAVLPDTSVLSLCFVVMLLL